MTKIEENLMYKEMCARMPYGLYFKCGGYATTKLTSIHNAYSEHSSGIILNGFYRISDNTRIFLRDQSDMTDDERAEFDNAYEELSLGNTKIVEFRYEHHLDDKGLIMKGLAIEVNGEDYDHACRMWNGKIEEG